MLKLIPICLLCLLFGLAIFIAACGNDHVLSNDKRVVVYNAILNEVDDIVFIWPILTVYEKDTIDYISIIRVDGTLEVRSSNIAIEQGMEKNLPEGYSIVTLTQEEYDQIPMGAGSGMVKVVSGDKWLCPAANVRVEIIETQNQYSIVRYFILGTDFVFSSKGNTYDLSRSFSEGYEQVF